MILGLPVVEGHELTKVAIEHATKNAVLASTKIVVIDNGSEKPYKCCQKINGRKIDVIRNKKNLGYYRPLLQLFEQYPDEEFIGLMHNDLMLYEQGWDRRMQDAFMADPMLGLIGLCGSREVDERGGRGGYTVCNFMGREVQVGEQIWKGQEPGHGLRIDGIQPSLVLDSLFMMFRRQVVPHLEHKKEDWKDITLAHFYDRIWPIRTIEAGYHVITMGSDCDHIGGLTTTGNERYRQDCIDWLEERGIPYENPETEMYLVAERRYLSEYRDEKKFLPAIILDGGSGHDIRHLAR